MRPPKTIPSIAIAVLAIMMPTTALAGYFPTEIQKPYPTAEDSFMLSFELAAVVICVSLVIGFAIAFVGECKQYKMAGQLSASAQEEPLEGIYRVLKAPGESFKSMFLYMVPITALGLALIFGGVVFPLALPPESSLVRGDGIVVTVGLTDGEEWVMCDWMQALMAVDTVLIALAVIIGLIWLVFHVAMKRPISRRIAKYAMESGFIVSHHPESELEAVWDSVVGRLPDKRYIIAPQHAYPTGSAADDIPIISEDNTPA